MDQLIGFGNAGTGYSPRRSNSYGGGGPAFEGVRGPANNPQEFIVALILAVLAQNGNYGNQRNGYIRDTCQIILIVLLVFALLHFFYIRQVKPDFTEHLDAIEYKLDL